MPPAFMRISKCFRVHRQDFRGVGIASPAAIWLIMQREYDAWTSGFEAGGGLIGRLIGVALNHALNDGRIPVTCEYRDLDFRCRGHAEWPFKAKPRQAETPVLIIPRHEIKLLTWRGWMQSIQTEYDGTRVNLHYPTFQGTAVREYLIDTGWPLKWKGEYFNTEPPQKSQAS